MVRQGRKGTTRRIAADLMRSMFHLAHARMTSGITSSMRFWSLMAPSTIREMVAGLFSDAAGVIAGRRLYPGPVRSLCPTSSIDIDCCKFFNYESYGGCDNLFLVASK